MEACTECMNAWMFLDKHWDSIAGIALTGFLAWLFLR